MGIPAAAGLGLEMRNCWTHENEGVFTERYAGRLEPHGCRIFRAKAGEGTLSNFETCRQCGAPLGLDDIAIYRKPGIPCR